MGIIITISKMLLIYRGDPIRRDGGTVERWNGTVEWPNDGIF